MIGVESSKTKLKDLEIYEIRQNIIGNISGKEEIMNWLTNVVAKYVSGASWMPDTKLAASGLSGVLASLVLMCPYFNAEMATAFVGLVMAAVHYYTPQYISDVLKRGDEYVKEVVKAQHRSKSG